MNGKIPVSFKISLLENKKANEYYSKLDYKTKEIALQPLLYTK